MRNRATRLLIPVVAAGLFAAACTSGGTPAPPRGVGAGRAGSGRRGGAFPRNETLYTSGPGGGRPPTSTRSASGTPRPGRRAWSTRRCSTSTRSPGSSPRGWPPAGRGPTTRRTRSSCARTSPGRTASPSPPRTSSSPSSSARWRRSRTTTCGTGSRPSRRRTRPTVRFTFSKANYQQWDFNIYSRSIVPKHIWEERPGEGRPRRDQREPVGHRRVQVPQPRPGPRGVGEERHLVGQGHAQPRPQAEVHRRHRQLLQRGGDGPAAPEGPRPVQQLPAGRGQPGHGQLRDQHLLPRAALHAVGQHGLAGAQHHRRSRSTTPPSARRWPPRST